ncbi:cytochrome P450 [Actinoallomurus purpureus]|uniref:cytochrome P450 n=1 Tax=Actinoallomurus purpureus TaxID=478114 RepID=UPI0020921E6F|nr:cytochrome P450 [Actinoallomurus purpureus]MCO6010101.1 cytochrome P450 [Actinoallomurus purpureus]
MTANSTLPLPLPLPYRREAGCPFNPDPEMRRLRAQEPIVRVSINGGDLVWMVTRFDDGRAILGDHRFSSELTPLGIVLPAPENRTLAEELRDQQPGTFIECDPPEHTRLRQMVAGEFTVAAMRRLRPRIEAIVDHYLDVMASAGPPVDLIDVFALPVPSTVICEMLGVPPDGGFDFAGLTRIMTDVMSSLETLIPARDALRAGMRELVARNREHPGDNLLGRIIREHGIGVTNEELVGIGNLLLVAGHETTANMLGIGTLALFRHPEQLAMLRDDPRIVERAVDELVRYVSIPNHGEIRTATDDVTINGTLIKKGEQVLVSIPSANRDESRFPDPDRLDFTRAPRTHLAYGHGIHHCVGAPLARLEMHLAFPALLRRFPSLRLAVPFEDVSYRRSNVTYGVHSLPVTW